MKILKFNEIESIDSKNESSRDLRRISEKIYDLVKNRPFTSKQDCISDINRILKRELGVKS
jgi:hypothetical protein